MINIIQSVVILYLLFKEYIVIRVNRNQTFHNHVLLGYFVHINKYCFYIPIRNSEKEEVKDEISLLKVQPEYIVKNRLRSTFSCLNTIEEVLEFQRDYSCVDKKFVDELVDTFVSNYLKHKNENS